MKKTPILVAAALAASSVCVALAPLNADASGGKWFHDESVKDAYVYPITAERTPE
ncbi:MAG: hypothetical protein LBI99_06140 [Propionibacteriaceae bacterium]|jgi:hypothetical protein|nr:hypothetical protein [Propionibacteriaceae bacterium]